MYYALRWGALPLGPRAPLIITSTDSNHILSALQTAWKNLVLHDPPGFVR